MTSDKVAPIQATVPYGVLRLVSTKGALALAAAALCAALVAGLSQALATQLRLHAPMPARNVAAAGTDRDDPCTGLTQRERDVCIAKSIVSQPAGGLKVKGAVPGAGGASYAGERLARPELAPAAR